MTEPARAGGRPRGGRVAGATVGVPARLTRPAALLAALLWVSCEPSPADARYDVTEKTILELAGRHAGGTGDLGAARRPAPRQGSGVRPGGSRAQRDRPPQPEGEGARGLPGRGALGGDGARSPARHSGADEGQLRRGLDAHDGIESGAGGAAAPRRRAPGGAAARGWRGHPGQDQPARAGGGDHHDQLARRSDPERVRSRPQPGGAALGEPGRRWRPASRRWGGAPTPAVRSGSRPRCTTSSGCDPRRAFRASTGSCRCRIRRTRAVRWPAPRPIWPSRWTRRWGWMRPTPRPRSWRAGGRRPSGRRSTRRRWTARGSGRWRSRRGARGAWPG